jgi:hypothetical protein
MENHKYHDVEDFFDFLGKKDEDGMTITDANFNIKCDHIENISSDCYLFSNTVEQSFSKDCSRTISPRGNTERVRYYDMYAYINWYYCKDCFFKRLVVYHIINNNPVPYLRHYGYDFTHLDNDNVSIDLNSYDFIDIPNIMSQYSGYCNNRTIKGHMCITKCYKIYDKINNIMHKYEISLCKYID